MLSLVAFVPLLEQPLECAGGTPVEKYCPSGKTVAAPVYICSISITPMTASSFSAQGNG